MSEIMERAPLGERLDPDRLARDRAWLSLHRAHPALGLEEVDGRWAESLRLEELGHRWLALDSVEQRDREADYLRAVLRAAARHEHAEFEAGFADEARTAGLARRARASVTQDALAAGPLTPAAIEAIVALQPDVVVVDGGRDLVVHSFGDARELTVWVPSYRAPALQAELETAWWEAAQRRAARAEVMLPELRERRVERARRAHVLLAWKRSVPLLYVGAIAALAGLAWPPVRSAFVRTLIDVVVAAVVLGALDNLVERWYHGRRRAEP